MRRAARPQPVLAGPLAEAGASMGQAARTRVMLTGIRRWREAAAAHGEAFGSIRPACTFVQVAGFIGSERLVEFEADAVVP